MKKGNESMDGYIDLYGAIINCAKEDYIRLHDHIHKTYNRIWPEVPMGGGVALFGSRRDKAKRKERRL